MRTRTLLIVGAIIAVAGGAYAWREYNRPTQGAGEMKVTLTVNAEDLHQAFISDETAANTKYVGTAEQAIEVKGLIRSIDPAEAGMTNVTLATSDEMSGVVCEFPNAVLPQEWKPGDKVMLKGICTGVNDLIPDVILVRCAPVAQ